jgi:hypothetical protein
VADSILDSVKKQCSLLPSYTPFDDVIILHINSVFSTLNQLGIGPDAGFMIEDNSTTWDAFVGTDNNLNFVKTYVGLKVRLLFDPPASSWAVDAMVKMAAELEWRLNVKREGTSWTDPDPTPTTPDDPEDEEMDDFLDNVNNY